MWKYALKRIGLALLTVLVILSITFLLMKCLPFQIPPGEVARKVYLAKQVNLGYVYTSKIDLGKAAVAVITEESGIPTYYYQVNPFKQLISWYVNIFTKWEWGTSSAVWQNVDAMTIILKRLPNSMKINIFSVIVSVPLGIALGIWAALKKNKLTDNIISTVIMVLISVPSFVLIIVVQQYVGYQWGWLPATFTKSSDPALIAKSYIMPVILLSFGPICGYCRLTRAELCEVMESEYLLLARTKGLTKKQAILRHALRNAMVPIVPYILSEFIGILGGSMILENVYGIQGIGGLFIDAIDKTDYNVLMVDMAFFTTIGLLGAIVTDISYGFIDPRIRMGER